MFDKSLEVKLKSIVQKIEAIEYIIENFGGITKSLEDEKVAKPAILMHLVAIAEQLDKISKSNSNIFEDKDIKGAYSVRNFIAHDYDGINLAVVEKIIREHLTKIKEICLNFIKE